MPGNRESGCAVWLTGLPSSGKTRVASALKDLLERRGIHVQILDSDELRQLLTPNPDYSPEERNWFYRVMVYMAWLLASNGVNVLIAATASLIRYRDRARSAIPRFAEVYLECPEETCRNRDPKGLWKMSRRGEITDLPGAGGVYEAPVDPESRVATNRLSITESAQKIMEDLDRRSFFAR